jgi:tetratricopeptide (TPR) repeat protein
MALELYEKCLAISIKALGEDHPDVADTYTNTALVYDKQGRYEMALELYEKCLAISIKALGEDHPDVADTYTNTALVYDKQGRYENFWQPRPPPGGRKRSKMRSGRMELIFLLPIECFVSSI